MISFSCRLSRSRFVLEADFAYPGGCTALFGPSGSGKTTIARLIAGIERPDRGRIVVADHVVVDTEAGLWEPAHRRRVGLVFQDGQLLPHLTVRQNLAYGRYFAPRGTGRVVFDEVVDLLGIGHLLAARPLTLSGGERQRVAIGRALLAAPRILVMDEPLASLDAERKHEILPFIERLRDDLGLPIVYVSHAVEEVARLATQVVRLAGGRQASALDIQREYYGRAVEYLQTREPNTQIDQVVDLWGRQLDAVESQDFAKVDTEIDWVIKRKLFQRYQDRDNMELSDPKISQLDLAYHDIKRGRGVFDLLQRKGLAARIATDEEIDAAVNTPPQTTRAKLRGEFISAAQEAGRDFTVDWVHLKLNDQAQRTVLCKDPFRSVDERVKRLIASM